MRIIETRSAPNPRRVRIFLAEKGLDVPFEEVDLMAGRLRTADFTALNPLQRVPVLVLDAGTAIADITALVAVDFMRPARIGRPEGLANLDRWHQEMSARPSARV